MEQPFSNREITEMFKDVQESLARIEDQTTKHNGRLKNNEIWRAYITGALAVITAVVVPTLAWALYILVNIDAKIIDSVQKALALYNIQ